MNVVGVRHNAGKVNSEKVREYYFNVPEKLIPYIKKGSRVICDTARGMVTSVVTQDIISVSDEAPQEKEKMIRFIESRGGKIPLKNIVGYENDIDIDSIKIPMQFKLTTPSSHKICARIDEWKQEGRFNTRIIIDKNGYLRDGYTAYLVAKMFDMPTLYAAKILV